MRGEFRLMVGSRQGVEPIIGWMDGIARETLPMSVDPVGRVFPFPILGSRRPRSSEFLR